MAPCATIWRTAVPSPLQLLSIAASFVCGQSDLQIRSKPLAFSTGPAVSATWTQQDSEFDSLYCVVFVDSGEATEELSNVQIVQETLLATGQAVGEQGQATGEEPETTTHAASEFGEPLPETTPSPADLEGSTKAMEEAQLRSSKCKAISSSDECSGDCEWHATSPENPDEAGPDQGGECELNAVVALQLLGEGESDSEPVEGSLDGEESEAPVRRTGQKTTHAVERLRGAAASLVRKPRRRLSEETGAGSAVAAVAEGEPLKSCDWNQLNLTESLPDPCIDAEKHRAYFFLQGNLVPDEIYIAYCATLQGAAAQTFFNLDVADEVTTPQPKHPMSSSSANSSNATSRLTKNEVSNATSRGPRAAGGSTLDDEGEAGEPASLFDGLYGGIIVVLIASVICIYLVRRQGARGIAGLLREDHEMLQTSASTSGSYVGPGDLAQTFSQLKDGPE